MAKHNKKRNVGLLHEQLILLASKNIIEGNIEFANKIFSIIEKHFSKGTELLKEFQLFNALANTTIANNDLIARRIIDESRLACSNHNYEKLELEKSRLIKEINLTLDKEIVYNQKISNYKIFSTIQALLNEWRGKESKLNPSERIEYEIVLENWLLENGKKIKETQEYLNKTENANPLVLNIMINKFNKKYGEKLNNEQINLLNASLESNNDKVVSIIENIKSKAKVSLDKFYGTCNNETLLKKKSLIESRINSVLADSNDSSISQALMISSLIEELESQDE